MASKFFTLKFFQGLMDGCWDSLQSTAPPHGQPREHPQGGSTDLSGFSSSARRQLFSENRRIWESRGPVCHPCAVAAFRHHCWLFWSQVLSQPGTSMDFSGGALPSGGMRCSGRKCHSEPVLPALWEQHMLQIVLGAALRPVTQRNPH